MCRRAMWSVDLWFYFFFIFKFTKRLIWKIILYNNVYSYKQIAAFGGFILLLGFWAFIWESQILFTFDFSNDQIAVSKANPFVSSFIAAFTSFLINRYFGKNWSLLVAINGALTGMVSFSIAEHSRKCFISVFKKSYFLLHKTMFCLTQYKSSVLLKILLKWDYSTNYFLIMYHLMRRYVVKFRKKE